MKAYLVGTVIGIKADEFWEGVSVAVAVQRIEEFKFAMKHDGAVDVAWDTGDKFQINIFFKSTEPYKVLINRVEKVFTEVSKFWQGEKNK